MSNKGVPLTDSLRQRQLLSRLMLSDKVIFKQEGNGNIKFHSGVTNGYLFITEDTALKAIPQDYPNRHDLARFIAGKESEKTIFVITRKNHHNL